MPYYLPERCGADDYRLRRCGEADWAVSKTLVCVDCHHCLHTLTLTASGIVKCEECSGGGGNSQRATFSFDPNGTFDVTQYAFPHETECAWKSARLGTVVIEWFNNGNCSGSPWGSTTYHMRWYVTYDHGEARWWARLRAEETATTIAFLGSNTKICYDFAFAPWVGITSLMTSCWRYAYWVGMQGVCTIERPW